MRRELERVEIPGENEARERAWTLVRTAHAGRQPTPPPRSRRLAFVAAVVISAGIVAAAVSSPGRALLHSIRETVGVRRAEPALFSLPGGGRLLVRSTGGVWVVHAGGSRRRLGTYDDAAWSPHGLYVAATRRNTLYALTPDGTERWSLTGRTVRSPRWAGSRTDTRIAYTSGDELNVVGGDGRGDEGLGRAPDLAGAPLAWRPDGHRVLAYALPVQGSVVVVDVDAHGEQIWSARAPTPVRGLAWSSDGTELLALTPRALLVYGTHGRLLRRAAAPPRARWVDAVFLPRSRRVVAIRERDGASDVEIVGTAAPLFRGSGTFSQLVSSPDGSRLLVAWPTADQWVFVPLRPGGRLRAVANVSAQFRSRAFPVVEGWAP